MKTIRITKEVKENFKAFADGKTTNKAMAYLLDGVVVDDRIKKPRKSEFSNIHMDDELFEKLKRCKRFSNESYSEVLQRLIDEKGKNE